MRDDKLIETAYDYVIIGSGFGGSVSALRLSQKGYKVLVIEKGKWYHDESYAKNAWNLKKWLWMPIFGFRGIMKMTVLRHVTIYSGVGVGGGSLTYGATLPTPKPSFFQTGSWAALQDWQTLLKPFYDEALRMLGATTNPSLTEADLVMKELAERMGKQNEFHPARVGVFFSDKAPSSVYVDDPYFDGEGPARRACSQCGSCMTGCRNNAKNTLDKNYLYFAQKAGAKIVSEQEVFEVAPVANPDGSDGYFVSFKGSDPYQRKTKHVVRSKGVIFSGGVLGTIPLLLKMKAEGVLPRLSKKLGEDIRTNNETVTGVTSFKEGVNFAQGVTIGSILNTDEHSHVEPINQNARSGMHRLLAAPNVQGTRLVDRLKSLIKIIVFEPKANLKVLFARNWGKQTIALLFMQHLDSTLKFKRGRFGQLASTAGDGPLPSREIPASKAITEEVERIVDGKSSAGITEALLGTPSTAHILGGAVMGASANEGVINDKCEVHGYHNMLVCDGSAISANPGVNPSLSITAVSEWAMSNIKQKTRA